MIELRFYVKDVWYPNNIEQSDTPVLQYRTKDRVVSGGTDFLGHSFTICDWSEWKEVPIVYESDEKVLATEKKS